MGEGGRTDGQRREESPFDFEREVFFDDLGKVKIKNFKSKISIERRENEEIEEGKRERRKSEEKERRGRVAVVSAAIGTIRPYSRFRAYISLVCEMTFFRKSSEFGR